MDNLVKRLTVAALSIVTVIGLSGAVVAAPQAHAQSLTSSQVDSILSLLESFGADQATIDDVNAALTGQGAPSGSGSGSGAMVSCNFNRNLTTGMSGSDVQCLQRYLNGAGFTLADSGAGSPGNETDYFGPITRAAVVDWQNAHAANVLQPVGLSSGTGYWGPSSIDWYNQLLSQSAADEGDDGEDVSVSGDDWLMENLQDSSVVSVPVSSQAVEFWSVEVTAAEDGELDSLTFDRRGVGSNSDFGDFYLFQDDTRISNARTMNSDTHEVNFSNLNLDLDSGDVVELTLVANVPSGASSGNQNYMELVDHDADVDLSDWEGSRGYTHQITSASAGSVDFDDTGSVANPNLGQSNARLARFKLDNVQNEDIALKRLILEQNGSVDASDLEDFQLEDSSGNVVATADSIESAGNNDLLTLVFNNDYEMEEGDTDTFTLKGDVTAGADSGDSIEFRLEEPVDLLAEGDDFGYGVTVNDAGGGSVDTDTAFPSTLQNVSIEGGQVTFTFDNAPSTRSVLVGGSDVALLDFTLAVEEFTEVDTLPIKVYAKDGSSTSTFDQTAAGDGSSDSDGLIGSSNNNLRDIKIVDRDTGSTVMGPKELSGNNDGQETVNLDDVWFMDAGETRHLRVTADIDSNSPDEDFGAEVDVPNATIEDINGDSISDVVPSTILQGNVQSAVSSDLSVGLSSSPTSDTVISGSGDFQVVGFRFSAGDASEVTLTDLTLTAYVDGDNDGSFANGADGTSASTTPSDIISSVKLVDSSGNELDSSQGLNSSHQAVFDDVDFTIGAGNVETVYAVVNIASNAPFGNNNDHIALDIANTGDVSADDVDGDTVSLSSASPNGGNSPTVAHEVINTGTLSLSVNGDTPDSSIVMAGASGQDFLSVDFDTIFEGFEIQKLLVDNAGDSGTSDEFGDVYLYDDSGNLLEQGSLDSSGQWQLSDETNGLFEIAEDATVHVRADVSDHNESTSAGSDSGDEPRLRLLVDDSDSSNTAFKAVGLDSGTSIVEGDSDLNVNENTDITGTSSDEIVGDQMLVRRALPTISQNSLSNTLSAGSNQNLLSLNVASESGGDTVSVKRFAFELDLSDAGADNANDLTLNNFRWYEGGSNETANVSLVNVASGTDITSSGGSSIVVNDGSSKTVRVTVLYDNGQELEVGPGNSQDVSLRANLTSVDSGDDSVSVSLVDDDSNFSNNYHDYFAGDLNVNSDVRAASVATDTVVFYDVDGNGNWNSSTDVQLGASGTVANVSDGTSGSAASLKAVDDANTSTNVVVFHDVTTSSEYNDGVDVVVASSGQVLDATSGAGDAVLDRVADGDKFSIFYEQGSASGDANSSTTLAQFDSSDLEAGNSSSSVSTGVDIAGYNGSTDGDLNFVWSDDSAASHGSNTSDWMNGYRVNEPSGVLSDISHTRS